MCYCWIHHTPTKWGDVDECCMYVQMQAYLPTFKDKISFGDVQLVSKWYTSVLHPGACFKLHANLQLIPNNKTNVIIKQ